VELWLTHPAVVGGTGKWQVPDDNSNEKILKFCQMPRTKWRRAAPGGTTNCRPQSGFFGFIILPEIAEFVQFVFAYG
jgi:hypothetical protein